MLKKVLVFALCFAMLFTLVGCGGNEGGTPTGGETPSGEATSGEAQKVKIRIGHTEAENRAIHMAAVEFGKWIEEASNGNITVEVFPNAVIAPSDGDMAEAAALGTIEIAYAASHALTNYSDAFGILDMPFLFDTPQNAFAAWDGELGKALNETLEGTGLTILGFSYNGARIISNNVRPIHEPADFKGIKMRTMQSPVHIETFRAFGANATPMGFGEIYTGLQQGTVEGQDNAASLVYAQQFYEVQKYLSLTEHNYGTMAFIANKDWYEGLSEENRALVDEGVKKYILDWQRNYELSENDNFIELLKEKGMEVNSITPENHQKFVDAVKPLHEKYAKEFGQELFDIALSYNK